MANKNLYFTHGYDRNGKQIVTGAVKIFLRKPYGQTAMFTTRDVTTASGNARTVTNVEGSIKLDDYMVKQVNHFFNVNMMSGSYLNVRVGIWGVMGKALTKFNLNDGDIYMFLLNSATLQQYNKKDGSVGYRTAGRNNQNGNHAQNTNAAPQAAQAGPGADDFAAIDDSEDLPF